MNKKEVGKLLIEFSKALNINFDYDNLIEIHTFLIKEISKKDISLANLFTQIVKVVESIKFFKTDKEMRIKFPDIYKMQLDTQRQELASLYQQLAKFGKIYNIDIQSIISK